MKSSNVSGRLAHYIVKAKIGGYIKRKCVDDLYGNKRLLFKPGLKLKKYGIIGDFWAHEKNKETLWKEIAAIEKRISEGLEKEDVQRAAEHVHEFLGDDVSRKKIERSLGYWSDSPEVKKWIEGAAN